MGERDPRADIVDDDPFRNPPRSASGIHRVHGRRDAEGTIVFDMGAPRQAPPIFQQFFGGGQWNQAKHHEGNIWHFSEEEKKHLTQASLAFTLALGFMRVRGISGISDMGMTGWIVALLLAMPVMFVAVGPAFILHEIGHKIVAKKNGCWAEFRADPSGLKFGIFLSFFLGFLFMAPGAVMVAGLVTRRQNGHIAVAGPLVNFGLFLIGIPLWAILLGLTNAYETLPSSSSAYLEGGTLVWQAMLIDAAQFWLTANLILGLFNMLPFGPLDGLKVKDWNETAYFAVLSLFLIPLALWWFIGAWSPALLLESIAMNI